MSTDPLFVEKTRDIVGLYIDPPVKAMELCVDEKSQIQTLDRTGRSCFWHREFSSCVHMTMSAMTLPPCLPRWTSPLAKLLVSGIGVITTVSF